MNSEDPFSPSKCAEMREELLRDGVIPDKFLKHERDVATFGINLACARPFPEAWRAPYAEFAARFSDAGNWLYVYPHAFTHVTLVTFASFSRHVRPSAEEVEKLTLLAHRVIAIVEPALRDICEFELVPQTPVLARAAGILPFQNPDGEVRRLREATIAALKRDESLHRELTERGLNVPAIIHSTLMRFVEPPPHLTEFLERFHDAAAAARFPATRIREIFFTSETRPYMREGNTLRKLELKQPPNRANETE